MFWQNRAGLVCDVGSGHVSPAGTAQAISGQGPVVPGPPTPRSGKVPVSWFSEGLGAFGVGQALSSVICLRFCPQGRCHHLSCVVRSCAQAPWLWMGRPGHLSSQQSLLCLAAQGCLEHGPWLG